MRGSFKMVSVYDMNRSRSRIRVNIHTLSDEKKCGGMNMAFHSSMWEVEAIWFVYQRSEDLHMCSPLYFLEIGGSCAAGLKGVFQRRWEWIMKICKQNFYLGCFSLCQDFLMSGLGHRVSSWYVGMLVCIAWACLQWFVYPHIWVGSSQRERLDRGCNLWMNKTTLNSRKAQRTNQKHRNLLGSDQQMRRLEEAEFREGTMNVVPRITMNTNGETEN